jgi:hypothetical protein
MHIYKCMLNVYKNQQNWQTGSRNLMGPKTLPTIYRYPISWEAFLDPSDSYFLFADFVDFHTHWTYILYMPIFSRIFLSNYWWQKSDIWSQASYRYPITILWEAFFDPSDSYFLFAEERGYHKWALAHSSSCFQRFLWTRRILTFDSISTCFRMKLKAMKAEFIESWTLWVLQLHVFTSEIL